MANFWDFLSTFIKSRRDKEKTSVVVKVDNGINGSLANKSQALKREIFEGGKKGIANKPAKLGFLQAMRAVSFSVNQSPTGCLSAAARHSLTRA